LDEIDFANNVRLGLDQCWVILVNGIDYHQANSFNENQ